MTVIIQRLQGPTCGKGLAHRPPNLCANASQGGPAEHREERRPDPRFPAGALISSDVGRHGVSILTAIFFLRYDSRLSRTMTIEAHFRENAMNLHIPEVRILEVHPAPSNCLRGNCQHSSPILQERNGLGLSPLLRGVADAAKLGYNFLNVAGVEPLRYAGLSALCRDAHRHEMLTSLITRDTALTAPQLAWLRFSIDLLGVGNERKGAARNRQGSAPVVIDTIEQRLAVIRDAGIAFAIAFSLTSSSLADLG